MDAEKQTYLAILPDGKEARRTSRLLLRYAVAYKTPEESFWRAHSWHEDFAHADKTAGREATRLHYAGYTFQVVECEPEKREPSLRLIVERERSNRSGYTLRIRLTAQEEAELRKAAAAVHLDLSNYARVRLFS